MGNRAIIVNGHPVPHGVNGGVSDIGITTHGSNWYFAVCAVMLAATFAFTAHSFTKARSHRVFHYITIGVTLVAAIAYFSMGSDLGQTPIPVQYRRSNSKVSGLNREIFYVRYIDWFVTTPLLLLDLLLTAALPWPTILFTLLVNEVMIITGLVGALVESSYKWGYFVFGCLALFWVAYVITISGRKHARALGPEISKTYTTVGVYLIFLWFLYPIAWGLSEGGNVIAPDSEAIFYGVLDVLTKPVYGAILLWSHRNIDPGLLGLHIRDYDDAPLTRGGYGSEKTHHNGAGGVATEPAAPGTTTGTHPTHTQPTTGTHPTHTQPSATVIV